MTDQSPAYHYQVIARALGVIDATGPALTLEDLAAKMQMSPAHFQRVFSHWVGISPKRYQQYLTLDHARSLLAERFTVLDTALSTGLSGPSRLHDLFLTWEAMSPGDYARGGAGLTIAWGWFDTTFGPAVVMGTHRGICGMGFAAEMGSDAARRASPSMTISFGATGKRAKDSAAPICESVSEERDPAKAKIGPVILCSECARV